MEFGTRVENACPCTPTVSISPSAWSRSMISMYRSMSVVLLVTLNSLMPSCAFGKCSRASRNDSSTQSQPDAPAPPRASM